MARNAPFALPLVVDNGGEAKVAHADGEVAREEEVAQLQVAVDHVTLVEVLHGRQQLQHKVRHLGLGQALAPLHQLSQRLDAHAGSAAGQSSATKVGLTWLSHSSRTM
jgi:hypothetical protein